MTRSADENNAPAVPSILSWVVPNLSAWLWLVFFLFLIGDPQRTRLVSSDSDANMHWRVGDYMLETKHVIRTDAFSHTKPGAPVVSKEWLSQILFALAGRVGGLTGLSVLGALVIATTFALLHRQLVRSGADLLTATFLVLIAAWASVPHWHARPHVFSFLLLLLWHQAILRFHRNGEAVKLALILGMLTLFWINLHGGYLAGFIVLGGYWLAALIERGTDEGHGRLIALTWVGLLCITISLLNPNGYHVHLHNFQFVQSSFFVNWLDEYASINFHEPHSLGMLAWLTVLFLAIVLSRPVLSAGSWIVLIVWSYFALYSVRNVTFFVILSAPILAVVLTETLKSDALRYWREFSARLARIDGANHGWITVIIIALVAVTCFVPVISMPGRSWPVAAVDFIQQNPARFEGNMFNLYGWGGYLLRATPSHKVFVDGRADFFGEASVRDYDEIEELRPRWRELIERYDVRWTLLPVNHRLNQTLAELEDWQSVYSDNVAVIYCKVP